MLVNKPHQMDLYTGCPDKSKQEIHFGIICFETNKYWKIALSVALLVYPPFCSITKIITKEINTILISDLVYAFCMLRFICVPITETLFLLS